LSASIGPEAFSNDASTRAVAQFLYRESLENGVAELQHPWSKVCRQAHDKVELFPLTGGTFGSILVFSGRH
jgi:hypothetical protein